MSRGSFGLDARRLGSAALLSAALLVPAVGGTQAFAADSGERLVMVTNTPAMIEQLEQKYDVGFVGEPFEAAVYVTDEEEALLRAEGYTIGRTLEDDSTWEARHREIAATDARVARAAEFARAGIPRAGLVRDGKKIVPTPGVVVIQRAYTFTNYAGRFLYVEAHNANHTDTTGADMSFAYAGPDGEFRPSYSMSNRSISPDGGDAGIGGDKISDGDAAPGSRYMYHRALVALRGDDANLQASQVTVRVSDADGNNDSSGVTEWANEQLPPRVANFQKDFITKYMDPTESYERLDQLAAQYPDIAEIVPLPYKTGGYQREAMAMMTGTSNPGNNPSGGTNQALAVQLFSKAMGHLGGNDITAAFVDPGAPNSPLSVSVDGNDITVSLGTGEGGALASTAAQVVAAINGNAAASALVIADTYNNNAGAGIVPARERVQLSDFLAAPEHVKRGPFDMRILRIGKQRDGTKTGVYIYCQQHAREWVTPITCVETAERLVRNYAIDATTKEYVDNLDIFILPSANPDGGHVSFYDRASQRRNLTRYCELGGSGGNVGNRGSWGVDLNRNNSVGTRFDGYNGASGSCTSDTFSGPFEVSEPEIKNEQWVADTFPKIKFAINIHTHGGYFMWAPGAYIRDGRVTLPAPNIGIENYFFEVADTILSHIKSSRNTVILPQRTGPIADVLYSAAGNSADDQYYRKGIIAYSFEAGAQRITVDPETGAIDRDSVGFQPCFAGPGTNGGTGGSCGTEENPNELMVNEGHDSAMEFSDGNYGLIRGALEYERDVTAPETALEFDTDRATAPPINYRFKWVNEPSVILYTTDGSTPTITPDDPATWVDERCFNETSTKCYQGQGPRRPGEVLQIDRLGIHDIKWMAVDIKGNQSAVQTQRFIVGPELDVGGTVPATLSLSLGAPAAFGPFTPGVDNDYTASTTANVISSAGDGVLSVSDPSPSNTGKLVNGSFTLAQPLQASASSMAGTGGAFAPVGGSANPTSVLTYGGPTSNDSVTLNFKQTIGRMEALRTGAYSKTLTFTLSTTQP